MVAIRTGTVPDDVELCVQLWVDALAHRDGSVDAEAMAERVRSSFGNPIVRFAVATSPAAGFAVTESGRTTPSEALLHFLAVDPRGWGHGVGAGLLADAITHSRGAGFESLVLEVRIDNVASIGLYERAGFVADGPERRHPLGGQPMRPYRLTLG